MGKSREEFTELREQYQTKINEINDIISNRERRYQEKLQENLMQEYYG